MNRVHFPCVTQKLKIHDGEFVSSNLLAQLTSTDEVTLKNFSVMSSSSVILLQYSLSDNYDNFECVGGFLCHVRQKGKTKPYFNFIRIKIDYVFQKFNVCNRPSCDFRLF